jgi:hypothetical protein
MSATLHGFEQLAPPFTVWNALSPGHLSSHVAPSAQLIEQDAMHVTLHIDPALHEMLPLWPSVMAQLACSLQSTLHESPHAPPHVDWLPHASVQLAPQVCAVTSQLPFAGQAQLLPVHVGGLVDISLQENVQAASMTTVVMRAAPRDRRGPGSRHEGEVPPRPLYQAASSSRHRAGTRASSDVTILATCARTAAANAPPSTASATSATCGSVSGWPMRLTRQH